MTCKICPFRVNTKFHILYSKLARNRGSHFKILPATPFRWRKGVIKLIPDASLLIQACLFIVLMLILNKLFFQPFLRFLEQRQAKIHGDEQEAARLLDEAERRRLQWEEGLHRGRGQALDEKGRIQGAGVNEGRQMLERVQREIDEQTPAIKAHIEAQSRQVLAEMESKKGDMAKAIAQKILGRSLR